MIAYAVVDPATGHLVAEYPTATDAEVDTAAARAHAAFATWRAQPISTRAALLARVEPSVDLREGADDDVELDIRTVDTPWFGR